MAAGHREAARSVLDDGEYAATLDLAGVERSYSGRRRHRARSRRPLLPTQPIRAPNATHRFSGGTGINRDHRVRDGAFAEDASRIRVNPGICARFRSIALNIFRFNGVKNVANEQWRNALSVDRMLAYNGL